MDREAKGPGTFFILPCIDKYITVDLRTKSFDVPPQSVSIYLHMYLSIYLSIYLFV